MHFRLLHDEVSGALTYLLADLAAGEAVLVDPRAADLPLLQALLAEHRLRLRWRLHTHSHGRGGAAALQALGGSAAPAAADAVLPFGDEHVQAVATPGHTATCRSWRWRDRLFVGDLLSVHACPEQPRPARPQALWDSVTTEVFTLPGETLLFAGHAGDGWIAATVHEQRRRHPWFAADGGRDDFLARAGATPVTRPTASPLQESSAHEHPFA